MVSLLGLNVDCSCITNNAYSISHIPVLLQKLTFDSFIMYE